MTTVKVILQTPQKVAVTPTPSKTVEVYRKGDTGLSAYEQAVLTDGFTGTEAEWLDSLKGSWIPTEGERKTGVDAGTFGELVISDDYLFVCVKTGAIGVAIWKKTLLFQT